MLCMVNHQALANLTKAGTNNTIELHEHNAKCQFVANSSFVEEEDEEIRVSDQAASLLDQ